jgi:hypothetical protein
MSRMIQRGKSIQIAIPAGGCQSGGQMVGTVPTPGVPVLVGEDLVGIPENSYAAATSGNMTLNLTGVYDNIMLKTGDTPGIGDKLYFDNADSYLTTTEGEYVFAGWAWSAAVIVGANTVVAIRLKQG